MASSQPELPSARTEEEDGGKMSLFEHLADLRKRLIYSAIAIGLGFLVGFAISKPMIGIVSRPMVVALEQSHFPPRLIYHNPTGPINLVFSLAFYLGIVFALPVVLYQIWLFVAPGLYKHERKAVASFIVSSVLLFLAGIAFGYFILLPYVLRFLISFEGSLPLQPLIDINEYFDLLLIVMVGLGVIFELPILIFVLSMFGIVTPQWLWKNVRYAILIISIIALIVTPTPDATTMLIFMAPMVALYFVGIGVSYMVFRSKRKREMAREGAH
ncbi:MAG TPA: twin-arginine translocase subunit TatC [Candidatus Acidoferrales bacterium]|nr:twin-arginine translocase subunit TatC [Candidatus Acidoferrales bacterium]